MKDILELAVYVALRINMVQGTQQENTRFAGVRMEVACHLARSQ